MGILMSRACSVPNEEKYLNHTDHHDYTNGLLSFARFITVVKTIAVSVQEPKETETNKEYLNP